MEFQGYIFLGVGVAISVLGFFLKKEARKAESMSERLGTLEILMAKNEVRDCERWRQANKLLEDRRLDCIKLFDKK
mgnify:CR=1 FL=1